MPPLSSYWDTSAFAKLVLIDEAGAERAVALFDESDDVVTSMLTFPEAHSAVGKARRTRQILREELPTAVALLRERWNQFDSVDVDNGIVNRAAEIVLAHDVSAADAIHLATALRVTPNRSIIFITWDRRQAAAAEALGLEVVPSAV